MLWSWYIFQNAAHSTFSIVVCLVLPHMLLFMNCKLKCTLFDYPDSQTNNISPASGVDKVILPVVADGHTHYTIREPFDNVFYWLMGGVDLAIICKTILWLRLWSSKDSAHLTVGTWFIAQKMISLCLLYFYNMLHGYNHTIVTKVGTSKSEMLGPWLENSIG